MIGTNWGPIPEYIWGPAFSIGIFLVGLFFFWLWERHKDRQHARECLRRFDYEVARIRSKSGLNA